MALRQYRQVQALADHASFRRAAEALGISQPAPTKSLFQIEKEVGHRLFDRHGQAIAPTVFGEIGAQTTRDVLNSQEAVARAIGLPTGGGRCEIRPFPAWCVPLAPPTP